MKISKNLEIKRLRHLMFNEVSLQTKPILIVSALIILLSLTMLFDTSSPNNYFNILFIGGFITTSFAFKDLHNHNKAHFSLMLPCTNLEKFLNKWLLTSIGYALGSLFLYYICSWINVLEIQWIFSQQKQALDIFNLSIWTGMLNYLVMQSVVLLGAITFKKYSLFKTALTVVCVLVVVFMLVYLTLVGAYKFAMTHASFLANVNYQTFINFNSAELHLGYIVLWIVIAICCLYLTYKRLTKFELN